MNTPTLQPKGIEQDLVATGNCDSRDRYAKPQARIEWVVSIAYLDLRA